MGNRALRSRSEADLAEDHPIPLFRAKFWTRRRRIRSICDLQSIFLGAGVDRSVALSKGRISQTGGAIPRLRVDGFEVNLKPDFFILLNGFGETGLISSKAFFPSLFIKFFISGHRLNSGHPHPDPLPSRVRGEKGWWAMPTLHFTVLQKPFHWHMAEFFILQFAIYNLHFAIRFRTGLPSPG